MQYIMNDTADGFSNTVYRNAEDFPHSYPSVIQGYGRMQMNKVLNFGQSGAIPLSLFLIGAANSTYPHYAEVVNGDDVITYTVVVSDSAKVRATLCYTDYPGVPGATDVRINTLRVRVTNTRTSIVYAPYLLDGGITSNLQVYRIPYTLYPYTLYP